MDPKHIADQETREKLMLYFEAQDSKIQSMLAWGSLGFLFSYVITILNIAKFYSTIKSGHVLYLTGILTIVFFLFALFVWIQWKMFLYKPTSSRNVVKALLHFSVRVTNRQINLLSGYMIVYFLIALGSCFLGWYEANYSIKKVLETTTPIGIMVSGAGLFLLVKLTYTRKTFINYLHLIDKI